MLKKKQQSAAPSLLSASIQPREGDGAFCFCASNLLLGQDHRNRVLGRLARQLEQCMDLALWHTGILPNEPRKKIDDSEMFVVLLEYHLLGGIFFYSSQTIDCYPME